MTELRAAGLLLRPPRLDDVPAIVAACAHSDIPRYIPLIPSPYTEADGRRYVEIAKALWESGSGRPFVIVDEETGELLGTVAIRIAPTPAVGYWLAPEARGRGVATRAVRLVVAWARREHGVGRVELYTHPENVASQRVAERAGFRRAGTIVHEPAFRDGTSVAIRFELP